MKNPINDSLKITIVFKRHMQICLSYECVIAHGPCADFIQIVYRLHLIKWLIDQHILYSASVQSNIKHINFHGSRGKKLCENCFSSKHHTAACTNSNLCRQGGCLRGIRPSCIAKAAHYNRIQCNPYLINLHLR